MSSETPTTQDFRRICHSIYDTLNTIRCIMSFFKSVSIAICHSPLFCYISWTKSGFFECTVSVLHIMFWHGMSCMGSFQTHFYEQYDDCPVKQSCVPLGPNAVKYLLMCFIHKDYSSLMLLPTPCYASKKTTKRKTENKSFLERWEAEYLFTYAKPTDLFVHIRHIVPQ